jgi:hypothetical protein
MAPQSELQAKLELILGSRNVYFQPPTNISMQYPCIVYNRDAIFARYADDFIYNHAIKYQVTAIDRNPGGEIALRALVSFPMCSYDRFYVADNLNHDVLTLYF